MADPNSDPFAQNPYKAVAGQAFAGGPTNAILGMQKPFDYPNNNPRSVARPNASTGGATGFDTSIPKTRYGSPLPFNPTTNNFSARLTMTRAAISAPLPCATAGSSCLFFSSLGSVF
jgi:hypothetical protein